MKRDWNEKQIDAFSSLGGSVLVSAAAGSGKSSVLVERVIRRLCDENNPCEADKLMIVTFTRAAASELRHKINKELSEKIRQDRKNTFLQRQQRLLTSAVIGTMDSFCGQLVRDNFWLCDVQPDFRILDNSEEKILMQQAVDAVLEEYYNEGSENFLNLLELFGSDKNDRSLIENIFTCYYYSMAYPFPDKWIAELVSEYDENIPVSETVSGRAVLDSIKRKLKCVLEYYETAIENANIYEETKEKYLPTFIPERDFCIELLKKAENGEWDSLFVALNRASEQFGNMKTVPKDIRYTTEIDNAFNLRSSAKKTVCNLYKKMPVMETQYRDDVKKVRPLLECFIGIVKEFSALLLELKKEKNAFSFSDISHKALDILVDENGQKTELAELISGSFEEILIDEYQDTNEAQEMLFTAISKDEKNMFVVGDVKQSIYRFRMAMPEIFIRRRGEYGEYDSEKPAYPAKIILDKNYRSSGNIIDTVNFIFKRIMNSDTGEIEYDTRDELLNHAEKVIGAGAPVEIHFLKKNLDGDAMEEGEHIAREIKRMLAEKVTVHDDKGNEREMKLGDICILMRSVKTDGLKMVSILREHGIPAACEANESFCELPEIRTVLSLLRAVDNPLNDIALTATMFSPIFGFTADELALVRLEGKHDSLYSCLKKYAETSEKAKNMLETLSRYKTYSVICPAGEMLRRVLFDTNYDEIVRAMPNGEERVRNLLHLLDYAQRFEESDNFSLSDFIRFIDRVTESGGDLENNSSAGCGEDAVRIMTIHKSKGLEFPIVFLARLNKSLIHSEENPSAVLLNPKTKIGVKRQDREKLFRFSTVQYMGTKIQNTYDDIAEELRVLYVAMTRAKERLIMVIRNGGGSSSINMGNIALTVYPKGRSHGNDIVGFANFARWILSCALVSSGCGNLRNEFGIDFPANYIQGSDYLIFKSFENEPEEEAEVEENAERPVPDKPDKEFENELNRRMYYVYPYERLTTVAAKRTASELNEQTVNTDYFASAKPAFMGKGSFTPAQRGTLMHLFMETSDFSLAENGVEGEIERLKQLGIFTAEQAAVIDKNKLQAFFESDLYSRIKASPTVGREQQFTVSIGASAFDERLKTDESVVVQGKIDCFFEENGEIVIVDYKTDSVKTAEELSDRYTMQMQVYKTAAEQFTGKRVKEVLLYSFALGDTVKCL